MKASEQYFPVVLFVALFKVVPTDFSESVDKDQKVNIQMKATELWYCLLCCTRWF